MAADFIDYSTALPRGAALAAGLRMVRDGTRLLVQELAIFQRFITGDASTISQFDAAVTHYGFGGWVASNAVTDAQRTAAKAAWDEMNSASFQLTNTNASQTGIVPGVAVPQACAKLGV